jgi:hypothetical protein
MANASTCIGRVSSNVLKTKNWRGSYNFMTTEPKRSAELCSFCGTGIFEMLQIAQVVWHAPMRS